jgi:hypothetical protein
MPRPLLEVAERSYYPGGPSISTPYRAAMVAIRSISASSGGASGWGGMLSDLAGSSIPLSSIPLMRPSMPAGERTNNNLAGPSQQ